MISRKLFFLASSGELAPERDLVELLILRKNAALLDNGLFFEVVRWEELLHSFHPGRVQEGFSAWIPNCDVMIVMFHTKVGKFTKEEFDVAYGSFKAGHNPNYILVYFKNTMAPISDFDEDTLGISKMKTKILDDQQLYVEFANPAELELSLMKQLDLLSSSFIREMGSLVPPDRAIVLEAAQIPTDPAVATQIPDKDAVRALAESLGLCRQWAVNPHLTFEEGDILYYWERRQSRAKLEAEFRARRMVLERAEENEFVIPDQGELSAKAQPVVLRMLNLRQARFARRPATGKALLEVP
jgi:hypothetical protein